MFNHKYTILEKIGSGMFGSIYKGQNKRTHEYVAIKVEPIASEWKMLVRESKIYYYLQGCQGIPAIKWFGKDAHHYYMVIHLLGESLQGVFVRFGTFSLASTFKIGIQVLTIFETIHQKGLVHRDIKPDNFLFGHHQYHQLYLIDFGFCKSYLDQHNRHILRKPISGVIGSINFCSLAVHRREEICRRDDLESLCYMLLYLHTGHLDWMNDSNESDVFLKKQALTHCPPCFAEIIRYVRQIAFDETPNYAYLRQTFLEKT